MDVVTDGSMPDRAAPAHGASQTERPAWPGLTLEAVLYAALFVGAAFIRFFDLGRWPLMPEEARQALAAWRFLQGQPVGTTVPPLLFDGALAGFFAFGASDAVARLLPALLGTAVVLTPLALRRQLGHWGALAATFLLAFSPTMVYYSRTLAGLAPALAGVGALLWALDLAGRRQVVWAKVTGGAGLALCLTSSPWGYTFILAALLFAAAARLTQRRGRPWLGWATTVEALRPVLGDGRAWAALVAVALPMSTAFFLNAGGLQGAADLLGTWLGRLVPGSGGRAWAYPLGILAYYEVAALVLGAVGAGIALRKQALFGRFLVAWAAVAIVLASLSGARDGEAAAMAVMPLALLGGVAVGTWVARLKKAQWAWVGVGLAVFVSLLAFWWLNLTTYSVDYADMLQRDRLLVGTLVAAGPLLLAGAIALFYSWVGRAETRWAAGLLGLALAAALTLRSSVALNFAYARDPREPLVVAPSAVDLRDMVAFLESWSSRTALDQHALTIGVQRDLEPLVPWYLRDFRVGLVSAPGNEQGYDAYVLPAGDGTPPPAGYKSTRFVLQTSSDTPLGSARDGLAWWLVGTQGGPVQRKVVELWVK